MTASRVSIRSDFGIRQTLRSKCKPKQNSIFKKNIKNIIEKLNSKQLGGLLRDMRVHQIFGNGRADEHADSIRLIKERKESIEQEEFLERLNNYTHFSNELINSKNIEERNLEKALIYSKFSTWKYRFKPYEDFVSDDQLLEVQVRLHESIQRIEEFKHHEKIFKEKTFGRKLASRIEF